MPTKPWSGYALGLDVSLMFTEGFGLNLGVDYNELLDGQWNDGDFVSGFEGVFIRPGIKIYF